MAGIEELKKRIIDEENENAKKIIADAELEALKILDKASMDSESILKKSKDKAAIDANSLNMRIISKAQLDARNMLLQAKLEMIDIVINKAKLKIYNMDKDSYSTFIEKLLLKNVQSGDEEIILGDKDKERVDISVIENVNNKLKGINKQGLLKLSNNSCDIKAGFILKKGDIEINCSIDSIIRMLRDNIEKDLSHILFN